MDGDGYVSLNDWKEGMGTEDAEALMMSGMIAGAGPLGAMADLPTIEQQAIPELDQVERS